MLSLTNDLTSKDSRSYHLPGLDVPPGAIRVIALRELARDVKKQSPCLSGNLFICAFKGTVMVSHRQGGFSATSNFVYVLCPKQLNHLTLEPATEGFAFLLSDSLLNELQQMPDFQLLLALRLRENIYATIPVDDRGRLEVQEIVLKMASLVSGRPDNSGSLLKSLFKIFLFYLSIDYGDNGRDDAVTREREITNRFFALISETRTMQKRINDYAGELQVAPNYLARIIKKTTGIAPIAHVHRRFILTAKKLARETPLSMKEIAYKLGFEDAAHFSKFFKVNTGTTFSDYKRSFIQAAGGENNRQKE